VKAIRGAASEALNDALIAIVEAGRPVTVRQVFYQVVVQGLIEKSEAGCKAIGGRLTRLRYDGTIAYEDIVDLGRRVHVPYTDDSVATALDDTATRYRRDPWPDAESQPIILIEKEGLVSVIEPVTDEWCVPVYPVRGDMSVSFKHELAEAIDRLTDPHVYYLGDHDPKGERISVVIERDLREKFDVACAFERIALTPEQIAEHDLPTRPTKRNPMDRVAPGFKGRSTELDALPAAVLRDLVATAITRHVEADYFDEFREAEAAERKTLRDLAARYRRRRRR